MYNGRGKRGRGGRGGGGGGGGNYGSAGPLKGLFVDGQWKCNCNPPLPAEHFKVRKESPNQGRWFYTCQKPDRQRCGFFLWEDDAKPREESAVLSNSRTEPQPAQPLPKAGSSKRSPPPPYTMQAEQRGQGGFHPDSETDGEEEEFLPWSLTGQEEKQLEATANDVSPPPITPKKTVINHGLATPATGHGKRKASDDDDLSEWHAAGLAPPTSAKRLNFGAATPQATPTPGRFRDALATPEAGVDVELEIMNILNIHNVRLENEVRSKLRDSLTRVNLRVQGIVKGRDVSRLQIKAKDAKLAEQQLRINTLEAELEAERAMVQHLRWERQTGADAG